MKGLSRAAALKIAAVLSFLLNASSVVTSLQATQTSATVPAAVNSEPFIFFLIGLIFAVVGVVAAWGTWNQQRWGIILTIVVSLFTGLLAAPGILLAPIPIIRMVAIVGVAACVLIIVLCLWRERRPAEV